MEFLQTILLQISFTTALWVVIVSLIAVIIGLAAFLKAAQTINKELLTPIKKRLDEKLFTPLEILANKITEIEANVGNLQKNYKEEIELLKEIVDTQDISIAFLNFKDSFAFHNNSSKAYFITDEHGRLEYVNDCFCSIFGLDSGQIETRYFHELPCRDDKSVIRQLWREAIGEMALYENAHTFYKGNQLLMIKIKAQPFIYKGEIKKFLGFIELLKNGD